MLLKTNVKLITILLFAFFLFIFSTQSCFGHDLIPKAVVEYMQQHPNASYEEIEKFIKGSSPGLAKKVKTKEDVIKLIRNQKIGFFDNAFHFLKLGVQHILSGADHILFILSLLLVFVSIKNILKLTSTFTIAHSITLILAALDLLRLTPRIVEPLIAFSISYVATTSVFFKNKLFKESGISKIATVFFFGLFHGLGFAGLLKEVQVPKDKFLSSLVSFNIGIEVGQLIVVLLALPFILMFRKRRWYGACIKIIAGVIALIGVAWGIQRSLAI